MRGTAFDASSGAALTGVTVAVGGKTAQSDAVGQYVLLGVPAGNHTLSASKDGYLPHTGAVEVVSGDTLYINVSLAPDRGPLGLTAETSSASGRIHLIWNPRATVDSYNLYWSTSPGVTPASATRIPGIQTNSYDHSGLNPGTKYYYVLAAVTNGVEGPISAEVNATAGNGIVIQIQDPGGIVADTNIQATVIVTSVFQLVSVTATVEDRTTPLVYQISVNNWHGLVSLSGLPSPRSRTVTFNATDVHGTVATASQSFEHDRKAVVTLESPLDGTVAQTSVRLRVTCVDDVPSGCANLKIGASTAGPPPLTQDIAEGVTTFDQDISLALFDGRQVSVGASITDNLGRFSSASVTVYVDGSGHLTKVAEVTGPGTILDATPDRLLTLDMISAQDQHVGTLKIQQRATGQAADLMTRKFLEVYNAHLTPHGAVFEARDDATSFIHGYEWRDGALLDLGITNGFVVDESYFAWDVYNGSIHRENLESGATIVVPGADSNWLSDVGPNGDVLYVTSFAEIRRFRDGVTTTLVPIDPDPNLRNGGALTDGVNVCYGTATQPSAGADQQFQSLIALTAAGSDTLLVYHVPPSGSVHDFSCLLNGGWIGFTQPAPGGTVQVWVRSPAGIKTQASFFSGVSVLEAVATDGRVVFTSPAAQAPRRRYLWTPGGSATDIGAGFGQPKLIDGQLYVMLGRALLRVD